MVKFTNNKYQNSTVKIDNIHFIGCEFINCTLEYTGVGLVGIEGCTFDNVKWLFTGPARNTIDFMRALYHGMGEPGKQVIDKTFDAIKQKA